MGHLGHLVLPSCMTCASHGALLAITALYECSWTKSSVWIVQVECMYCVRLTFITNSNSKKEVLMGVHESSLNITFPLLLLAFGSIFVGYLVKEITHSMEC